MVGEGLVQGGVLVVDAKGDIMYRYLEETGSPIPVDAISRAINSLD